MNLEWILINSMLKLMDAYRHKIVFISIFLFYDKKFKNIRNTSYGGILMICYNCKKEFIVKRSFLNFFETKKYYICNACQNSYPIELYHEDIPLENYVVRFVSIFKSIYKLYLNAYIREISKIVERLIHLHRNYFFIFLESYRLTDFSLELLSFIADVEHKSILLVCCKLKK